LRGSRKMRSRNPRDPYAYSYQLARKNKTWVWFCGDLRNLWPASGLSFRIALERSHP
jgi:hypothetical protein